MGANECFSVVDVHNLWHLLSARRRRARGGWGACAGRRQDFCGISFGASGERNDGYSLGYVKKRPKATATGVGCVSKPQCAELNDTTRAQRRDNRPAPPSCHSFSIRLSTYMRGTYHIPNYDMNAFFRALTVDPWSARSSRLIDHVAG